MRISIIIPAHEAHRFVGDALDSLAAQQLPSGVSLQAVVVSDDGTDYATHFTPSRARSVQLIAASTGQVAAGASAARNVGLRHSNGNYVSFLDADDVWLPQRACTLLPYARTHGAAVCAMAITPFGAPVPSPAPTVFATHGLLSPGQALQVDGGFCPIYRRDCITHLWDESVNFAEDVLFNHRAITEAGGLYVHPEPLMQYRLRSGSASHDMPHASHRAARAYSALLSRLAPTRSTCMSTAQLAERFERKRALNAAYLHAWAERPALTFETFIRQTGLDCGTNLTAADAGSASPD